MILPDLHIEKPLWDTGFEYIAGFDEVGRGSWAGPLVVGAVILPKNFKIPPNFGDSKQLKPQTRRKMVFYIKEHAQGWAITEMSVPVINKFGIGQATQMAFRKLLKNLHPRPDFILIDAFYIKHVNRQNQKPLIKGDQQSASIAAASIVAKVHRDALMKKLAKKYPQYGFGKNKGYGTTFHQQAIKKYGFSEVHRISYKFDFLKKPTT